MESNPWPRRLTWRTLLAIYTDELCWFRISFFNCLFETNLIIQDSEYSKLGPKTKNSPFWLKGEFRFWPTGIFVVFETFNIHFRIVSRKIQYLTTNIPVGRNRTSPFSQKGEILVLDPTFEYSESWMIKFVSNKESKKKNLIQHNSSV